MKSSKKKPLDKPKSAFAIRKANNLFLDFSNIKCSWNSLCKNKSLQSDIQKIILNINQIDFLATRLLNYHIIRCIEENLTIPELNQPLYYTACRFVSEMKKRKSTIDENNDLYISFSHFTDKIKELPFRDNMGALIANLNVMQITNAKNHLKLNFYKRLRTYLSLRTGEKRSSVLRKWLENINAEEYKGDNVLLHFIRKRLLNNIIPTENNILENTSFFLKVYYKILKEIEKYPNTKKVRTFTLLPIKSGFTMSHITICNNSLRDILAYTTKKQLIKNFKDVKDQYWRSLFHIEKYETQNQQFAYQIKTDGYAVSLLLQRERCTKKIRKRKRKKKKEPEEKEEIQLDDDYEHFVGIDPGERMLFTSYDNNDITKSISTKQYRHDCKMRYARRKRENWYKNWKHYDIWRNIPSMKTTQSQKVIDYFSYVLPKLKLFFDFHTQKNFRGLKFTSYCRSKRKLNDLCNTIISNSKTLVGFGDYSRVDGVIKRHPTAPVLKLKEELKRRSILIEIDEYKTSKTCSDCHKEVVQYRNRINKNGKVRMSKVHSVIRCKNNECLLCCMDRDINASRNILNLLECIYRKKERPECFRRIDCSETDNDSKNCLKDKLRRRETRPYTKKV